MSCVLQIIASNKDYKRQAKYVKRNIEARSCNHCCRGKTIGVTYSECVFVPIVIQDAFRLLRIVTCCLPGSTVFFHMIS